MAGTLCSYLLLDLVQEREAVHVLQGGAWDDLQFELRVLTELHQCVRSLLCQFGKNVMNDLLPETKDQRGYVVKPKLRGIVLPKQ